MRLNMTGCPNGCARPYSAEIGIVGRTKKTYDIYVGGIEPRRSPRRAAARRRAARPTFRSCPPSSSASPTAAPKPPDFEPPKMPRIACRATNPGTLVPSGFGDWCAARPGELQTLLPRDRAAAARQRDAAAEADDE